MKHFCYNIAHFDWDATSKTFSANEDDLYEMSGRFSQSFPNNRTNFFITNPTTVVSVRFQLKKETDIKFHFESEGGIACIITKHVRTE